MENYLVDVPVKINIWTRPECQRRQMEIIKKARPSMLFIQSDGGRNEIEWNLIKQNREFVDSSIDWNCTVYRLYEDVNNGLYAMSRKTTNLIWSKVDRCIFLEDDDIPSTTFFSFCKELLDRYENDLRIAGISGTNYLEIYDRPEADYFFSGERCVWGTATWRRTEFEYQKKPYKEKGYTLNAIVDVARSRKKGYEKLILGYSKDDYFGGHIAGGEFNANLLRFSQNQLYIIPKKNMVTNIGFGSDSEHSDELKKLPRKIQKLYNMKAYDLDNIKHPEFVVCDLEYERRVIKITGDRSIITRIIRKLERAVRSIIYGDFKNIMKGLRRTIKPNKET